MSEARRAVVIGAGIVGVCSALQLRRAGYEVAVVDPQPPGSGATFGNAGSLSTGSVAPMAMPGMLQQVPKWLLDPDGPLSVRWRYLPRALPWLFAWIRASSLPVVERSAAAIAPLVRGCVGEYKAILPHEEFERLVRQRGQLVVSRQEASGGEDLVGRLRREHGVPVEKVSADELRQLEPALDRSFKGGILITDSAHTVDPQLLAQAVADLVLAEGGRFVREKATGFVRSDARVTGVETSGGAEPAEIVVIAAGAASAALCRMLGDDVPLESERGYHVVLPEPGITISRPIGNADDKFFSTPMAMGLRVAGTVEIAGLDAPPRFERAEKLAGLARKMFPGLNTDRPTRWLGHRPSVPDSVPVIGKARRHENVIYAFGHGHVGLTSGPITGRMVAGIATGGTMPVDPAPYAITRFAS
ncbi:FAD-dependent oxidoreductase [Geminicoccaceae bacterium 1502E]|nr:FAD-dependent oxidoreductase [Geminicoccaceae bacterium 1502E]